jgi:RHS repeat-associated protein
VGNPYFFTGRRLDFETGLYYYRARMYSANLGRFLQTDPIGYADGINWYAYCGNNPVMFVDPTGEFVNILVGGAVAGAMVGSGAAIISGAAAAMTTAGVLGTSSLVGASAGVVGNTTTQVIENYNTGQALDQAFANVDMRQQLVAGGVGAVSGLASGGIIVANAAFQAQSQTMNQVLSNNLTGTSQTLYQMGASPAIVHGVQQQIVSGMSNVGLSMAQVSMVASAINSFGMPIAESFLNNGFQGFSSSKRKK